MIVHLKTWRYSIEAVNTYHGASFHFDEHNMVLNVFEPSMTGVEGVLTAVTIVAGDELTVVQCNETCADRHGKVDADGELCT